MAIQTSEYKAKVDLYREIYSGFIDLCASGKQRVNFRQYCREHGVDSRRMADMLKEEFRGVKKLPGYRRWSDVGKRCMEIYEDFKALCAEGRQPGTFTSYCNSRGVSYAQMSNNLNSQNLTVVGLPGFSWPSGCGTLIKCQEIPFEDIIFEDAGFLPAEENNVITVSVDGHTAVHFPADTDVDIIAQFIKKMEKEVGNVES